MLIHGFLVERNHSWQIACHLYVIYENSGEVGATQQLWRKELVVLEPDNTLNLKLEPTRLLISKKEDNLWHH